MFGWFRRKPTLPPISSANPGRGPWIRAGFSNSERSWGEEADALDILVEVLKGRSLPFVRGKEHVQIDNGLVLRPQFVELQPRDDGLVRTATTVEVNHPELCPEGTFEYQHFIGQTTADSIRKGLEGWADTDLPVFMDALRPKAQDCMVMLKEYPATERVPARRRQMVLGPTVHMANKELAETGGPHDFCPCCLLTNSFAAFAQQLESDRFFGIRLFATRDQDGVIQADCRVDGIDWPPGVEALSQYVARWPDRGLEYRKQYVAFRTLPN
jgi:hypothetical protein